LLAVDGVRDDARSSNEVAVERARFRRFLCRRFARGHGAGMGWPARQGASASTIHGDRTRSMGSVRRISGRSLRGATTLEHQALPAVIVASLTTLGMIQLILTW